MSENFYAKVGYCLHASNAISDFLDGLPNQSRNNNYISLNWRKKNNLALAKASLLICYFLFLNYNIITIDDSW